MSPVLCLTWYRFRSTFTRRWGAYVSIVVLVALLGGLAMGAVAAARRTQSSFATYMAGTNPSDLTVLTGMDQFLSGGSSAAGSSVAARIAKLADVKRAESYAGLDVAVLAPNGAVAVDAEGLPGSIDGEYFNQDRVTIVAGRMADPERAGEVVVDAKGTQGQAHVGEVVPVGFYTNAEEQAADFGSPSVKPYLRIDVKVVGKAVFSRELIQDDVDAGLDGGVLFTPALTDKLLSCCVSYTETAVQLERGSADVANAESEIERLLPHGSAVVFYVTALTEAKADRAIKPESIAIGVFGGIAALAALLIVGQVIGRQVRREASDAGTLRALGASPSMTFADGLLGVLGGIAAGSVLAAVVAIGLSPLAPIGTVRMVEPDPGVAFDWTVLGFGVLVLVAGLSGIASWSAYRQAPHRVALGYRRPASRAPGAPRAAARLGLPAPAVEGTWLALDTAAGPDVVPVWSAILGAALAIIVVVATVTFGSSLNTLVSHPPLYGWNWTYALSAGETTYIPQARAAAVLDHDPAVAAWTGVYFGTLQIDSQTVPIIGMSPDAPIGPPVLSGHGLQSGGQVVLGPDTLAALHKRLGDVVDVRTGTGGPTRLRIVGTATLASFGIDGTAHPEMGTGAVLAHQLIPGDAGNPAVSASAGPNDILVRLRPGANTATQLQVLQRIVPARFGGSVSGVQRPAEIVNYRSMGTTPALLGAALGAGSIAALALTLVASVRRRRRDLALLKTLGFTHRQVAATVAWQSSIAVGAGTVVGVPLGIAVGRFLWELFARQIDVVPEPSVPVLTVILIAAGALVLANLVAAAPGRIAARTPTAPLLRAE